MHKEREEMKQRNMAVLKKEDEHTDCCRKFMNEIYKSYTRERDW